MFVLDVVIAALTPIATREARMPMITTTTRISISVNPAPETLSRRTEPPTLRPSRSLGVSVAISLPRTGVDPDIVHIESILLAVQGTAEQRHRPATFSRSQGRNIDVL